MPDDHDHTQNVSDNRLDDAVIRWCDAYKGRITYDEKSGSFKSVENLAAAKDNWPGVEAMMVALKRTLTSIGLDYKITPVQNQTKATQTDYRIQIIHTSDMDVRIDKLEAAAIKQCYKNRLKSMFNPLKAAANNLKSAMRNYLKTDKALKEEIALTLDSRSPEYEAATEAHQEEAEQTARDVVTGLPENVVSHISSPTMLEDRFFRLNFP